MSDEILAWIQFAIEGEDKGLKFYEKCYEAITEKRAHELFKTLIEEEKNHKKMLLDMLNKESGDDPKKVKKSLEDFNKMSVTHPVFDTDSLKKITDKGTLIMEMFNISAGMEKKAISLYLDLEEQQKDKKLKDFFHWIAKQELRHKKQIESIGMSLFGMADDEDEQEDEEKELRSQKVIIKEFSIVAESGYFKPNRIEADKGDTVVLKLKSIGAPAGFCMVSFFINEYLSPGKDVEVKFLADTAGEFEFFSNVPFPKGNANMRGKVIIKGENEQDDAL